MEPACPVPFADRMVKNFVADPIYRQLLRNRHLRHAQRLEDVLGDRTDPAFSNWVLNHCQACPSCSVLVTRSEGCSHMTCNICRTEFCYQCGQPYSADCNCRYSAEGPRLLGGREDDILRLKAKGIRRRVAARVIQRALARKPRTDGAWPCVATGPDRV